jgi:hypothetical protein
MKLQTTQLINIACLTLSIVVLSPLANAATYRFSQGGYTGRGALTSPYNNGRIVGSFEGEDTNHDGVIDSLSEMKNLSLNFAGNSFFNGLERVRLNSQGGLLGFNVLPDQTIFNILNNSLSISLAFEINHAPGWVDYHTVTGYTYPDNWFSALDVNLRSNGLSEVKYNTGAEIFSVAFDPIACATETGEGCIAEHNKAFETIVLASIEPLIVTQTPIPGALWLFASGLAWLGVIRRKKSD